MGDDFSHTQKSKDELGEFEGTDGNQTLIIQSN